MKNAHERFGKLIYRRHTEKTATNLRVSLDAFVGEERGLGADPRAFLDELRSRCALASSSLDIST